MMEDNMMDLYKIMQNRTSHHNMAGKSKSMFDFGKQLVVAPKINCTNTYTASKNREAPGELECRNLK